MTTRRAVVQILGILKGELTGGGAVESTVLSFQRCAEYRGLSPLHRVVGHDTNYAVALRRTETPASRLTDINVRPWSLVAEWGMTEKTRIRLHLAILTAYSFLLSFAAFPILTTLVEGNWNWDFHIGFFCLIPSIFYWPVAHCLLLVGKSPRMVHLIYWVAITPITFCFALFSVWVIGNALP